MGKVHTQPTPIKCHSKRNMPQFCHHPKYLVEGTDPPKKKNYEKSLKKLWYTKKKNLYIKQKDETRK